MISKAITVFNVILFIVSASAIDSQNYLPIIGCVLSLMWLLPCSVLNYRRY